MIYFSLNNGLQLPAVGLGTHKIPNEQLGEVIKIAYEVGYRKFDTAWLYQNEEVIGEAIKKYSIPRDQIFITSKLHIDNMYWHGYHRHMPKVRTRSVKKAFEESCDRLQTDYIDLYLVHWPFPGYQKMWDEMVKLYRDGRIRALGISSFLPHHIEELLNHSDVVPQVNQYEVNPFNSQVEETLFNQSKDIHVEAYASFGTTKSNESASTDMLGNETILSISEAHKKTPSQVILRWSIQRGISVIPRSKSRCHLAQNLDIFDFVLTDEEMAAIAGLNQNRYSRGNPHNA